MKIKMSMYIATIVMIVASYDMNAQDGMYTARIRVHPMCKWINDNPGVSMAVTFTCMVPGFNVTPVCITANIINYGCALNEIVTTVDVKSRDKRIMQIAGAIVTQKLSSRNFQIDILYDTYQAMNDAYNNNTQSSSYGRSGGQRRGNSGNGVVDDINKGIQRGMNRMYNQQRGQEQQRQLRPERQPQDRQRQSRR